MRRENRCESCRFWDTSTHAEHLPDGGFCRVLPPSLDKRLGIARWPTTEAEDWCGRWNPDDEFLNEMGKEP